MPDTVLWRTPTLSLMKQGHSTSTHRYIRTACFDKMFYQMYSIILCAFEIQNIILYTHIGIQYIAHICITKNIKTYLFVFVFNFLFYDLVGEYSHSLISCDEFGAVHGMIFHHLQRALGVNARGCRPRPRQGCRGWLFSMSRVTPRWTRVTHA